MIKAPCLDCEDRVPRCHSTCKRYLKFRAELDAVNQEIAKEKDLDLAKNQNIARLCKSLRRKK